VAGALTGRIEVNDVSFRYGENQPYVFRDLSMTIRAGEYVAIVGRTGCGKSTLVRLLLGFEKPENGSVFYDNYDLSHTDPVSIRKSIGAVMQNGQLLMGDIYSNITLSAPLLSVDEAWEAAEVAAVADDIRNMPMGMHTLISEGAGGISGGQKQRLLIARAVAPKPKILIFDEATSALDNITQKQVSEALDAMKCTRLVIAHRLSTIRHCDRILFVENGEIAAVLINGIESEANATLKRVYIEGNKIRLCAENPMYSDQIFFENDMNKVKIIGKAVAFLSTVK
jgi:ABC-type bacteriocin/lantibiotic exporter with double-glycine peptidase domain